MYCVAAFYKFVPLNLERVEELRHALIAEAERTGTLGLVLLSSEGINATVAGLEEGLSQFKRLITAQSEFADITFKDSLSARRPFRRFKVDRRAELITLKKAIEAPGRETYLSPQEWHGRLQSGEEIVVLDVRNTYETELGFFRGATTLPLEKFSDLTEAVRCADIPRERPILMYCTGGIRCEKAIGALRDQGFEKLFQLEGGILKYLEEFPEGFYEGECFVFDHRVAVDRNLHPSKRWSLCPLCGNPGEDPVACGQCGRETTVCRRCFDIPHRRVCSKNCAYHLRRALERDPSCRNGGGSPKVGSA